MKRKLSSNKTFGLKVFLPGFLIIICGIAIFAIFFGPVERRPPLGTASLVLPAILIIPAAACWMGRKYKVVRVQEPFLYVSNYLKEISIPLSDIGDVTEMGHFKGCPVTIHLKTDSAFGRKITFMPIGQGLNPFAAQTIVTELKEAVIKVSAQPTLD